MDKTLFKDKYCKLVTDNGFVLYGTVIDADSDGFLFETDKGTSFFAWTKITSLVPKGE